MSKSRKRTEQFKKYNTRVYDELIVEQEEQVVGGVEKRTRRNPDQLLADCIVDLYTKIESKIKSIDDQKKVVCEIFEALDPLIVLHKVWRENNDRDPRDNIQS